MVVIEAVEPVVPMSGRGPRVVRDKEAHTEKLPNTIWSALFAQRDIIFALWRVTPHILVWLSSAIFAPGVASRPMDHAGVSTLLRSGVFSLDGRSSSR